MGDYTMETTYKYVGRGAGDIGVLQVPSALRPNFCLCVVPAFLLLLLVPIAYLIQSPATYTTTLPPPPPPVLPPPPLAAARPLTPPPPPYNCNFGLKAGWSGGKHLYCRKKFHIGCPTSS